MTTYSYSCFYCCAMRDAPTLIVAVHTNVPNEVFTTVCNGNHTLLSTCAMWYVTSTTEFSTRIIILDASRSYFSCSWELVVANWSFFFFLRTAHAVHTVYYKQRTRHIHTYICTYDTRTESYTPARHTQTSAAVYTVRAFLTHIACSMGPTVTLYNTRASSVCGGPAVIIRRPTQTVRRVVMWQATWSRL